MTIQNKTIIGFAIPEEVNDILEFEKNHIDFIRHDTSSYVYFVKEEFYTINPKEEGEGVESMYECFHCGERSVVWDCDFSFEDYGEEGEGIIQECHCTNCGARITYRIPLGKDNE